MWRRFDEDVSRGILDDTEALLQIYVEPDDGVV